MFIEGNVCCIQKLIDISFDHIDKRDVDLQLRIEVNYEVHLQNFNFDQRVLSKYQINADCVTLSTCQRLCCVTGVTNIVLPYAR